MAATKSVEKKTAPKKTKTAAPLPEDPSDGLAQEYLAIRIHRSLVSLGESSRVSDIVREIGDETVTMGLARHIMETLPRRFTPMDRRWDITQRYLDKQAPLSRTLQDVIGEFGAPIALGSLAMELATIYGRVREHFLETAPRLLRDPRYFVIGSGEDVSYGLRSWLLDSSAGREDDVLFYNYLTPDLLEPYRAAAKLDWSSDPVQAFRECVVMGDGKPVDNRILQWYAWKALGEDFDALQLYAALLAESDEFIPLPDHRWVLADAVDTARVYWQALAGRLADFVEEAAAPEPVAELPITPLEVTDADVAELESFTSGREDSFTVSELLTNVLDVTPGSRTFDADSTTLATFLKQHPDKFVWVGADRFRVPGTLPPYLGQIPESLTFPTLPRFETADGEILDQPLTDAAFDAALIEEILDPVAQDVGDQEEANRTRWADGVSPLSQSVRLVLKTHHKEIGTFPLAQIPRGFLTPDPTIVEIIVKDADGASNPVYVDYAVQLMYGLFDLYSGITAESGAVFHLEKTDHPAVYKFVNDNETDTGVFITSHRYDELTDYRNEVETGPVSTYDIVRRILDHYRKGCSFLTLLTEVNIVRRTPRRLLASVLSGYTAFHERANRWTFDPKKEPEGFDRRKSPFIVRK